MKIVVDMNLSHNWIAPLAFADHEAIHWSSVGPGNAPDETIMALAKLNDHVVLTADLGFGGRLVRAADTGPSVVQLRGAVTLAAVAADTVISAISASHSALASGAILTVETTGFRVRRLSYNSAS